MVEWITENWDSLMMIAGSVWMVVTIVIGLTPSTKDDAWLRRVAERWSFLKPSNAEGQPLSLPGQLPKVKVREVQKPEGIGESSQ